jgi:hypothetical protein
MPKYIVDYSGLIVVDADSMDNAADLAYEHLAGMLDYFDIMGVKDA